MTRKYEIGKVSRLVHKDFCKKYPEQYDMIVDIVETIGTEDIEKFLQVCSLECIREQYMRTHDK